ncbi:hypothetical protein [Frigidibacter sp. MR17.24]|uniref:hypothetical protein n=1 Tax=Frigidibacter sp. MR17.24 TaxID=3127345 RepID=UPI003012E264
MPEDDKQEKALPPTSSQPDKDTAQMPDPPQRLVDLARDLEERLQRRRPRPKADGVTERRPRWLH